MAGSSSESTGDRPSIVGDVVFGSAESPVAVCTLGSRALLPELAGRPEIAVAGRVFTENLGVEKMVENLAAMPSIRYLLVCGRETRHKVGQTILALHRHGLDGDRRVVGSDAPEPVLPNLSGAHLAHFRERIVTVDRIGVVDAGAIVEEARRLAAPSALPDAAATTDRHDSPVGRPDAPAVERIRATRDPASAWVQDPAGYFVILVDREGGRLLAEQYDAAHRLLRVFAGRGADEIGHTIVRQGQVTVLAHAAYLGRELARAEAALALGLHYEQDRPLAPRPTEPGRSVRPPEEDEQ
jgi:tetrahydromethanopterin S-methyltransferase subunit A